MRVRRYHIKTNKVEFWAAATGSEVVSFYGHIVRIRSNHGFITEWFEIDTGKGQVGCVLGHREECNQGGGSHRYPLDSFVLVHFLPHLSVSGWIFV